MPRYVVNVSDDLADRISRQAASDSRPLKWHIVYLLEQAADVHARELADNLAANDSAEVCHAAGR